MATTLIPVLVVAAANAGTNSVCDQRNIHDLARQANVVAVARVKSVGKAPLGTRQSVNYSVVSWFTKPKARHWPLSFMQSLEKFTSAFDSLRFLDSAIFPANPRILGNAK